MNQAVKERYAENNQRWRPKNEQTHAEHGLHHAEHDDNSNNMDVVQQEFDGTHINSRSFPFVWWLFFNWFATFVPASIFSDKLRLSTVK